jgi:hypothetical protein
MRALWDARAPRLLPALVQGVLVHAAGEVRLEAQQAVGGVLCGTKRRKARENTHGGWMEGHAEGQWSVSRARRARDARRACKRARTVQEVDLARVERDDSAHEDRGQSQRERRFRLDDLHAKRTRAA